MSYIPARYIKLAAAHDITITIYDESLIQAYNTELESLASPPKKPLKCHLKVGGFYVSVSGPCVIAGVLSNRLRLIQVWGD
jgi:hypothetical protein